MADGVTVVGADRLARTLGQLVAGLDRLEGTDDDAAALVASAAASRAPRRTGALARSVTHRAGVVLLGTPYGATVHNGSPVRRIPARPFATTAAAATQPAWLALYHQPITELVRNVRGA